MKITQETLQQYLHYDSETGIFYRRLRTANRVKVGEIAGSVEAKGYISMKLLGVTYKAHRLAWLYMTGTFPKSDIDHINGDRSDNRFINLREATRSQNTQNSRMRTDNCSGIKGVYWAKAANKWAAQCTVNGSQHYLGVFESREQAAHAYKEFAKTNHGDFFYSKTIGE